MTSLERGSEDPWVDESDLISHVLIAPEAARKRTTAPRARVYPVSMKRGVPTMGENPMPPTALPSPNDRGHPVYHVPADRYAASVVKLMGGWVNEALIVAD